MSYIAFFDLDKTILDRNSGEVLIRRAYQTGLMSLRSVLYGLYLGILYRFDLRDTTRIIDRMAEWMSGVSEEAMTHIAETIFKETLQHSIRPEIITEMDRHRTKGARIVMLSASLPNICSLISTHLDMDDVICSNLEVVDGFFTGKPIGKLCFGDEKLERVRDYCEGKDCQLQNAYYYADSISDAAVMDLVGNPICVSPDKKLARIAAEKGWRSLKTQ